VTLIARSLLVMSQQYSGFFIATAFACLYCLVSHSGFHLQTVAVLTVDNGDEVPLSMQSHRISSLLIPVLPPQLNVSMN